MKLRFNFSRRFGGDELLFLGECGLFGDFLSPLFGELCNFNGLKIGTELVFIFRSCSEYFISDTDVLLKFDVSGARSEMGFNVFGSIFTIECFLISDLSDFVSFLSFSGLKWTWYMGLTPEAGLPKYLGMLLRNLKNFGGLTFLSSAHFASGAAEFRFKFVRDICGFHVLGGSLNVLYPMGVLGLDLINALLFNNVFACVTCGKELEFFCSMTFILFGVACL